MNLPATPADTPYDTTIYTVEYSGASDFPQYAATSLPTSTPPPVTSTCTPTYFPAGRPISTRRRLAGRWRRPTSVGHDGNTDYYLIPTQDLPLLNGLRDARRAFGIRRPDPTRHAGARRPGLRLDGRRGRRNGRHINVPGHRHDRGRRLSRRRGRPGHDCRPGRSRGLAAIRPVGLVCTRMCRMSQAWMQVPSRTTPPQRQTRRRRSAR